MENSPFKTLVMEIRPRLQSVNVYIILNAPAESVALNLNADNFEVIIDGKTCKYPCNNFKILADSLTLLHIREKFISFRFLTNNANDCLGQFKTEFLRFKRSVNKNTHETFLTKNTPYEIQCVNCSQTLNKSIIFERVLPLPSELADASEWFCHGDNIDKSVDLNPKLTDIFYTETHAHLNASLFQNILITNKTFVCKRCLFWLGIFADKATARVWFNTVIFKSEQAIHKQLPLEDVFTSVRAILNSSPLNFAKILLLCQVSDLKIDYILLWVVEAKLQVVFDCEDGKNDCSIAKVLFRYENVEDEVLKQWQSDNNICTLSVSKTMIIELLKHLYKYNKFLPEEFSCSNGFNVSYLPLYNGS